MNPTLNEVLYLHELSLSIGNTLDYQEACSHFINAFNSGENKHHITIWTGLTSQIGILNNSILIAHRANPSSEDTAQRDIDPVEVSDLFNNCDFIVQEGKSFLSEKVKRKKVVIFKLQDIAFLEVQSDTLALKDISSLVSLNKVVQKFGASLNNCFSHQDVLDEIRDKKELEKKVRSSSEFPEENPNPVFRVSKYGRLLYANKSSFMIMGHLKLKIGKKITLELLQKIRNSSETTEREFVLYVNYRYYSFLTVNMRNNNYLNIYGTNVTLLKEGERKLRKSEKRYRELVELANDIICQTDIMGKITYINPIGKKVLKSEHDEILGKNFFQLVHPDQKVNVKRFYKRQIRKKLNSTFLQFQVLDLQGNILWIEQKVQPLIQNGELKGFSAIARDVTARVVGDELLKRSEEKLRHIIDNAFDGIITVNQDHQITEWNPQARKIFGYTAKEALGTIFTNKLCQDKKLEVYNKAIVDFMSLDKKSSLKQRYEFKGIHKNGTNFPIELTISPMKIETKYFFSIFIRDITTEKQGKKELEKALRKERELGEMKSKFVSMTSHEFRTPLTTIRSSIELLTFYIENQDIKRKDKIIKNLVRINNEISRLTRLMNDILTIGRLDASRMTYNPSLVDICLIAKNIINFNFSKQRKVSLTIIGKKRLLSIDENVFTHILTNLISNALKYSVNAPAPVVKILFEEASTTISVKDNGIGIPEKDLENLFSSFFRASNVGNIQGTGLGLSIVKQFVEMMKGKIEVKSQLNDGSEFVVKLFC